MTPLEDFLVSGVILGLLYVVLALALLELFAIDGGDIRQMKLTTGGRKWFGLGPRRPLVKVKGRTLFGDKYKWKVY